MSTASTSSLPLSEILEPSTAEEVADIIRKCADSGTPVYPIGGGCSLDFGVTPKQEGIGLSMTNLSRIVEYPERDMTITVEAGLTMQRLSNALAENRQRLPLDVPQADVATVGGVVATNFSGSLRFSQGGVRDQVIGISAVDGRGMPFRGGGNVVKNVAGYDFCKLLTGSLGTLGVITQLTFKVRPIPQQRAVVIGQPRDLDHAEELLSRLGQSATTPAAIELLGGPEWASNLEMPSGNDSLALAVVYEGTQPEVDWMVPELESEWRAADLKPHTILRADDSAGLLGKLAQFPAQESPLVVKASVVPSHTTRVVAAARHIDPACSFQSHAGNGVTLIRFSEFPSAGIAKTVLSQLQPAAALGQGHVVILSNPSGVEATRLSVWGVHSGPVWLMNQVKSQFDPHQIMNPGRFVYE